MLHTLEKPAWLRAFDAFLYKPAYLVLCGILTAVSNILGAEFLTYTCFVFIVLYLCLFGRDLLPTLPLFVCSYIAPSRNSNPGRNEASMFSLEGGGLYLIILAALLVIGLTYRILRDKELGRMHFVKCKRVLLPGMLALGGAYLVSGLFSEQLVKVGLNNVLFAFIQTVAIILPYLLITATVKWEEAPAGYLAWTGMCVGYVLLAQLGFIYLRYNIVAGGVINRDLIYTGWGHYNNMGALLAMMIPFPFFLTGKTKHSSVFYISGLLFLGGVLFTCSRGSILCGVVTYLVSYIISLLHSRRARANAVIHICTALGILIFFLLFSDHLLRLFSTLLGFRLDPSGRDSGYIGGLKQFWADPIFGATFYPVDYPLYSWSTSQKFVSFFPARWHNTIVQLLASCGVVGIGAYIFHRFQTVRLFLKNYSGEKMFPFVSMLTLLLTSMVDCHFFNVGPVLFYSVMLAFVEKRLDK